MISSRDSAPPPSSSLEIENARLHRALEVAEERYESLKRTWRVALGSDFESTVGDEMIVIGDLLRSTRGSEPGAIFRKTPSPRSFLMRYANGARGLPEVPRRVVETLQGKNPYVRVRMDPGDWDFIRKCVHATLHLADTEPQSAIYAREVCTSVLVQFEDRPKSEST